MFFKGSGKGQAVKHEAPETVIGRFWGPGGDYRGGYQGSEPGNSGYQPVETWRL